MMLGSHGYLFACLFAVLGCLLLYSYVLVSVFKTSGKHLIQSSHRLFVWLFFVLCFFCVVFLFVLFVYLCCLFVCIVLFFVFFACLSVCN